MKKIIKQILREHKEFKERLLDLIRTGDPNNIELVKLISQGQDIDIIELLIDYFKLHTPPYFKILEIFDFSVEELTYILTEIFEEPILWKDVGNFSIRNQHHEKLYWENPNGYWEKREYDDKGNRTYYEISTGYWEKTEYDENGKVKYWVGSNGVIMDKR
tara:strand:- start:849 stop:1328 length:480 start_codon:yes stop_codon:yes gene_type:complete